MTAPKKKATVPKDEKYHFNGHIPMSLWRLVEEEVQRAKEEGDDLTNIGVVKRALRAYLPRPRLEKKPLPPEDDRRPPRVLRANGRASAVA